MSVAPADMVFVNGVIRTLDATRPETTALAVCNGKVVGLGAQALKLQGANTKIVELDGAFVMPGLLDVHNHHMIAGQMDLFELNVSPALTLNELLDEVTSYAQSLAPDAWVVGGSWGAVLTQVLDSVDVRKRLDDATGGRPALLKDDSKHNRWANTRALELAGVDAGTPDPVGGEILRDASGEATGVLFEAAGALVEQKYLELVPTTTEQLSAAAARGIEILHSYGITGFQDAAASLQLMRALKALDDRCELHAWVVSSMAANDFIFGTSPLGDGIIAHREETRSEHHRPNFIKIFLDGVPPTGTAAFLEPYLPEAGFPKCHCGGTTMDPAELEGWLMHTAAQGISAKIHCTGDASVRLVLDTVEKVRNAGFDEPKYHVAHGQFVHPDDVARFGQLGVVADISPSLWFPGVIPEAIASVISGERATKMHPNRALLDSGAMIAGGSDWPVSESPNIWEGIYGLITRKDPTGRFAGSLWPEQAITLDEAIAAYTTAPARAMGIDDVAGTLMPGMSADFVVLNHNPYVVDTEVLPSIKATQTWFAGHKVFEEAN